MAQSPKDSLCLRGRGRAGRNIVGGVGGHLQVLLSLRRKEAAPTSTLWGLTAGPSQSPSSNSAEWGVTPNHLPFLFMPQPGTAAGGTYRKMGRGRVSSCAGVGSAPPPCPQEGGRKSRTSQTTWTFLQKIASGTPKERPSSCTLAMHC